MREIVLASLTDLLRGVGIVASLAFLGGLAAYMIRWPRNGG